MATNLDVLPAATAVLIGVNVFSDLLPKVTDLAGASKQTVRLGELGAAGITIGLGVLMSSVTHDPIPLGVAIALAAGLVMFYEYALTEVK